MLHFLHMWISLQSLGYKVMIQKKEKDRERKTEISRQKLYFYNLILEEIHYHFPHMLTQTNHGTMRKPQKSVTARQGTLEVTLGTGYYNEHLKAGLLANITFQIHR